MQNNQGTKSENLYNYSDNKQLVNYDYRRWEKGKIYEFVLNVINIWYMGSTTVII